MNYFVSITSIAEAKCTCKRQLSAGGKDVYVDLPEKTDFSRENGGLGRIVCDMTKTTICCPALVRRRSEAEGVLVGLTKYLGDE